MDCDECENDMDGNRDFLFERYRKRHKKKSVSGQSCLYNFYFLYTITRRN